MKTVIIGAGLLGLTTAYQLRQRGHEVTVIDSEAGVARGASFANGALLTPSMSEPWNEPGVWRILLTSLLTRRGPLRLRARGFPSLAGWGLKFLVNSGAARFERNTQTNLALALSSLRAMDELRAQTGIRFYHVRAGSLRLFRSESALQVAVAKARRLSAAGLCTRSMSAGEAVALEPTLESVASQLKGAIHYQADAVGDAHEFSVALERWLRQACVSFRFSSRALAWRMGRGRVAALETSHGMLTADHFVVAAGSESQRVLKWAQVALPVRPIKGYSITFENQRGTLPLRVPIIDDALHVGIVPLKASWRIVGGAELAGRSGSLDPAHIDSLLKLARRVLPNTGNDRSAGHAWCGLRPVSADGVPIIGATRWPNLWINTGHGHLGWTLAAASSELLADLMMGTPPSTDPAPFALARFEDRA